MDLLPVSFKGSPLDTIGVTHALTVYGSRPAKEHTLYKDVHRLGVYQRIKLLNGKIGLKKRVFAPESTNPLFVEKDMHRYSDYFIEAIRAMGSNDGNVVYLSSGWDSTSILAVLVHVFGNRKVRAVIGRMRYSERSGVINQFEIDRAKYHQALAAVLIRLTDYEAAADHAFTAIELVKYYPEAHYVLGEA